MVPAITTASFFLDTVFALPARPGPPEIGSGLSQARPHAGMVLECGAVTGVRLGTAGLMLANGDTVLRLDERGARHHDGGLRVGAVGGDQHEDHYSTADKLKPR